MDSSTEQRDSDASYCRRNEPVYGPHVLAVFFGSASCKAAGRPSFKAAMRRLGKLLQQQAAAQGRGLYFAAVAVDWVPESGFAYLRDFGEFDEVASGGVWWNTIVCQRLFGVRRPSVPTIVLYERIITPDVDANTMIFGPERELMRLSGSNVIEAWIARGAPIPDPSTAGLDGG